MPNQIIVFIYEPNNTKPFNVEVSRYLKLFYVIYYVCIFNTYKSLSR